MFEPIRKFLPLAVLVLSLLCGCTADRIAHVRSLAARELACDESSIRYTEKTGWVIAEGCGEIGHYYVPCGAFGNCFDPVAGKVVTRLVRKQAAFDLQCIDKEVVLTELGQDTWGAAGCGKQASYIIVPAGCSTNQSCRVVQNTQAQ